MNLNPLIEKIRLLESKLGSKYSHKLLEPFKFDSSNPVEVQKAAKKIAEHIGLPPLIFIISYAYQKEKIGGHIQLNSSNEVFIEIANMYKSDCDVVLSILSHEICHKYLHINNIRLFPEFENEILTDIATVYTGLGKLSLNGCEKTKETSQRLGNKTTITTIQYKVGYMNRQQFAFVYFLICGMRKSSVLETFRGLSKDALTAIREASKIPSQHFSEYSVKEISKIDKSKRKHPYSDLLPPDSILRSLKEEILFYYFRMLQN